MKIFLHRLFARAPHAHSMPMVGAACVALAFSLFSCSSIPSARHATWQADEGEPLPHYSIVCIIHGDSGYLYHDAGGDAHRADEVTLEKAKTIAEQNTQAEVFIFHERHRRRFLFLFPRRDGTLYYYRHGRLLAQESYWRDQGQLRFDPEMALYNRFRTEESPELVRLFLYFGHEIPEFGGTGYDASYKDRKFTVDDLADGLKCVAPDSTKVDLVVLSTCFGGTPHTIAALAPYARYIIASPDNLHLSYFDLRPLERLDTILGKEYVPAFANTFARNAFDKLTEDVQTAVTVVVYDTERVQGFLDSVDSTYDRTLTTLQGKTPASIQHCDCAEDSAYVMPGINEGITVLYRPARFGRLQHKESHSGWECWKLSR